MKILIPSLIVLTQFALLSVKTCFASQDIVVMAELSLEAYDLPYVLRVVKRPIIFKGPIFGEEADQSKMDRIMPGVARSLLRIDKRTNEALVLGELKNFAESMSQNLYSRATLLSDGKSAWMLLQHPAAGKFYLLEVKVGDHAAPMSDTVNYFADMAAAKQGRLKTSQAQQLVPPGRGYFGLGGVKMTLDNGLLKFQGISPGDEPLEFEFDTKTRLWGGPRVKQALKEQEEWEKNMAIQESAGLGEASQTPPSGAAGNFEPTLPPSPIVPRAREYFGSSPIRIISMVLIVVALGLLWLLLKRRS